MFRYLALGLVLFSAAPALAAESVFERSMKIQGTSFLVHGGIDGFGIPSDVVRIPGTMAYTLRVDDVADTIDFESFHFDTLPVTSPVVGFVSGREHREPESFPDVPAAITSTVYIYSWTLDIPEVSRAEPLALYYSHADVYRHDRAMDDVPETVIGRAIGRYIVEGPTERFEGTFDRTFTGNTSRVLPQFELFVGEDYPTSLQVLPSSAKAAFGQITFDWSNSPYFSGIVDGASVNLNLQPQTFITVPEPSTVALLALSSVAVLGRLRAVRRRLG